MPATQTFLSAITPSELDALFLSFKVALVSSSLTLPFALLLGFVLARKQFWGKALLDATVHLPLVLPPVVIGYLLLVSFNNRSPIGQWLLETTGFSFAFNWWGAALASAIVALPLMVRAIRSGVEGVDTSLEQVASTLGASPLSVYVRITLPLIAPNLLTAWFLGFARSLGEFGATITFVSNIPQETQTLPLAMFQFIETPGAELAAFRLCVLSVVVALTTLLISEALHRKSLRQLGLVAGKGK